jgi:hypothetical protein
MASVQVNRIQRSGLCGALPTFPRNTLKAWCSGTWGTLHVSSTYMVEQLTVIQLAKEAPGFMEPEGSSL